MTAFIKGRMRAEGLPSPELREGGKQKNADCRDREERPRATGQQERSLILNTETKKPRFIHRGEIKEALRV